MSTRRSFRSEEATETRPRTHLYYELMTERYELEIDLPWAQIIIPAPQWLLDDLGLRND